MNRNSCVKIKKKWMKQEWVDVAFSNWINEIIKKRFIEGKDKKLISFRRITKALYKISLKPEIEDILFNADLEEDRWQNGEK